MNRDMWYDYKKFKIYIPETEKKEDRAKIYLIE